MCRVLVVLFLALIPAFARAQLRTALEVRSLSREQADEGRTVDLRVVVVFSDPPSTVFVQDETAGTFFQLRGKDAPRPGDEVRVTGVTFPGLYLPGIAEAQFEVIGHPGLPEAIPIGFDELVSGRYHYQRVSLEGVVRTVAAVDEKNSLVRVALGSRVVEMRVGAPLKDAALVDARVRVVGLTAGEMNPRRQLVVPYLRCTDWTEIEVLDPPRKGEAIPAVSPEQLLNFVVGGQELRRVKVSGDVLAVFPNGEVFLRGAEAAVGLTRIDSEPRIEPGDFVECLGFPEMDRFSARLVDAVIQDHFLGETLPEPRELSLSELADGEEDGNLVRVAGELVDHYRNERGEVLVLREGNATVRIEAPAGVGDDLLGSRLAATGIAVVESTRRLPPYRVEAEQVILRLRESDDLVVLAAAPWWTPQRMAIALGLLIFVSVLGALWIVLLQRQVRRQTTALRQRIEHEAVLEERQRLAREFHDSLEQDLTGLSLRLDAAAVAGGDERLSRFIEGSRTLVSRIRAETRNLVSDLREDAEGAGDLALALRDLVERGSVEGGPKVSLVITSEIPPLPTAVVHHLRMIAQESVTNAIKHAEAKTIVISAEFEGSTLRLRIRDDGRGFDPKTALDGKGGGHFGCMGMRERCRRLGANIEWESKIEEGRPEEGCVVDLTLLIPREVDPAS